MAKRSDHSSSRSSQQSTTASSRAVTPPKGRPTRSRSELGRRNQVLGSNLQWLIVTLVAAAALIALLSVVR